MKSNELQELVFFLSPAMATEVSHSWKDSYKGMSSDNIKGLVLALSSSFFIGASFIVKKKGLKKAGASGIRAGTETYFDFNSPIDRRGFQINLGCIWILNGLI